MNRIKSTEREPHQYVHSLFDQEKNPQKLNGKRIIFKQMVLKQLTSICRKINLKVFLYVN